MSVYVDGRMGPEERAAFEARLQAEPALRRQVEATRLLVGTARQLPAVRLPRNFVVPSTARVSRTVGPAQSLLRLGSAFAAVVFVAAVALDLGRSFAPRMQFASPAPPATSAPVVQTVEMVQENPVEVQKEAAPAPAQPQEPAAEVEAASAPKVEAPMAAESAPALQEAAKSAEAAPTEAPAVDRQAAPAPAATSALAESEARGAGEGVATAEPTVSSTSTSTSTSTSEDMPASAVVAADVEGLVAEEPAWLRLVAVLALLAAIILGVLGWRRV